MIFLILGDTILLPLMIAIPSYCTISFEYAEKITSLFFGTDILINLNTGFYHKGHLNTTRSKILHHYLKRTLIYDTLFMFPFFLLPVNINLYYFALPFKLLRIIKLPLYFATIDALLKSIIAMKFLLYIKKTLVVIILLHWLSCL